MEVGQLDEPIRCKWGQTYDETFYFNDQNGNPVDVSAYTATLVLRENPLAPVAATAVCTLVGTNGFRVVISSTSMSSPSLKIRTYKTDLKMTAAGPLVDYGFEGDFIVEAPITQ